MFNLDDIVEITLKRPKMYYVLMEEDGQEVLKLATENQIEEVCGFYNETKEEFIKNHTISVEDLRNIREESDDTQNT